MGGGVVSPSLLHGPASLSHGVPTTVQAFSSIQERGAFRESLSAVLPWLFSGRVVYLKDFQKTGDHGSFVRLFFRSREREREMSFAFSCPLPLKVYPTDRLMEAVWASHSCFARTLLTSTTCTYSLQPAETMNADACLRCGLILSGELLWDILHAK